MARRSPREHLRRLDDKVVVVNAGVQHTEVAPPNRVYDTRAAVRDLAAADPATLPREDLAGSGLFAKWKPEIRGVTKRGHNFQANKLNGTWLKNVDVRDSDFSGSLIGWLHMHDVDMSGARLRDVTFHAVTFCDVSMRGADLRGATFFRCGVEGGKTLDLTDSNVTRAQIDALEIEQFAPATEEDDELRGAPKYPREGQIEYRQYHPDDIVDRFGVAADTLKVLMWAGDVEVRDNRTYGLVPSDRYDPRRHHIPQWAVPPLGLTPRPS